MVICRAGRGFQEQAALFVKAGEAAMAARRALIDGDGRAKQAGRRQPGRPHRCEARRRPAVVPGAKRAQQCREGAVDGQTPTAGGEVGHRVRRVGRVAGQIDPHPDNHRRARPTVLAFEQNAAHLGAVDQHIIGPFEGHRPRRRQGRADQLMNRQSGHESQRRQGRRRRYRWPRQQRADYRAAKPRSGPRRPRPALWQSARTTRP